MPLTLFPYGNTMRASLRDVKALLFEPYRQQDLLRKGACRPSCAICKDHGYLVKTGHYCECPTGEIMQAQHTLTIEERSNAIRRADLNGAMDKLYNPPWLKDRLMPREDTSVPIRQKPRRAKTLKKRKARKVSDKSAALYNWIVEQALAPKKGQGKRG